MGRMPVQLQPCHQALVAAEQQPALEHSAELVALRELKQEGQLGRLHGAACATATARCLTARSRSSQL